MKKVILVFAMVASLAACSSSEKETAATEDTATAVMAEEVYACPMHCEGDKTYTEAGKCPVCKMDLAVVEKDGTSHDAEGMHMEH